MPNGCSACSAHRWCARLRCSSPPCAVIALAAAPGAKQPAAAAAWVVPSATFETPKRRRAARPRREILCRNGRSGCIRHRHALRSASSSKGVPSPRHRAFTHADRRGFRRLRGNRFGSGRRQHAARLRRNFAGRPHHSPLAGAAQTSPGAAAHHHAGRCAEGDTRARAWPDPAGTIRDATSAVGRGRRKRESPLTVRSWL